MRDEDVIGKIGRFKEDGSVFEKEKKRKEKAISSERHRTRRMDGEVPLTSPPEQGVKSAQGPFDQHLGLDRPPG